MVTAAESTVTTEPNTHPTTARPLGALITRRRRCGMTAEYHPRKFAGHSSSPSSLRVVLALGRRSELAVQDWALRPGRRAPKWSMMRG